MTKRKQGSYEANSAQGVTNLEEAREWVKARGIEELECVVPDQAGVARGSGRAAVGAGCAHARI